MDYDNTNIIPFHEWYEENKYTFPDHLTESVYENIDFLFFLQHVFRPFDAAIFPKVHNLMLNHYPVFAKETRPKVLKRLHDVVDNVGYHLILKVYEIVQDQFVNLDLHEKYPDFEKWRKSYMSPRFPKSIDENSRDDYPYLSYEEWIEYRISENKASLEYFNWYENRFRQYTSLLNAMLMQYYPQIGVLGTDEKVMLTVVITDSYDVFKTECEQIELFIDCNFPEDDATLDFNQFADKFSQLSREIKAHVESLRSRRISGEKI